MKIPSITSMSPIKTKARKLVLPMIAAAALTACTQPNDNKSRVSTPVDTVQINKQTSVSEKTEPEVKEIPLEDVKITKGFVKNRNFREIEKITGLSPKEFEMVKTIAESNVNKLYQKDNGKYYFKGTSNERRNIFDPYPFSIVYTTGNEKHDKDIRWDSDKKCFFSMFRSFEIRCKREANNDFSIVNTYDKKSEILNFSKDGKLKTGEAYLPDEVDNKSIETQTQELDKNVKTLNADLNNIGLFETNDKTAIAKFINALGLSDLEYINKKDANILFLKGSDSSYKLNVIKPEDDDDTIIGIANKVTDDGESEIYLIKGEIFSTNKSDKLILSKIRVVQEGLADDSPVKNKAIKETRKIGNNKTTNSYNLGGEVSTPWLRNLFSLNTRKFYDGKMTSEAANEINEIVTEENSDLKTLKIISIDKRTGKVTVQGN